MKQYTPTRKVGSGVVAGALTVVLVYVLDQLWGIQLTPEVAAAVTVLITFITSWFVPDTES